MEKAYIYKHTDGVIYKVKKKKKSQASHNAVAFIRSLGWVIYKLELTG